MSTRRILLAVLLLALTPASFAQQWFSVQSAHLISYSCDGNDRGAFQAAQRSEELIAIFGEIFHRKQISFSTPLRVIANLAPLPQNAAATAIHGSALIRTPAANFVIVDFSRPDSWPRAARLIATLTLEDNYPRAQPWFDSGIASYLAGIQVNADQMQLGQPPPGMAVPRSEEWIPFAKLIEINELSQLPATQRAAFEAESWALARWLIGNSRMSQAGDYLNALQWHGATPERALAEAFSMSPADLEREVRESLAKPPAKNAPMPRIEGGFSKARKLSAADAHVLEASLSLWGPEADRTLNELVAFMRLNQENAAVHRSLAWAFLLRNDPENAAEHIRRALALDDSDAAMHYLYARWVNQGEADKIRIQSAEAHMSTELKAALQRDPNYAAAMELLGLAELSGDDTKPALENFQRASALCPRNSRYYLNLARAYEAIGNLEAARNLMLYASTGGDAIAGEARGWLNQLDRETKRQQDWKAMGLYPDPNAKHSKYDNLDEAIAEDEKAEAEAEHKALKPRPDTREIEFLKGRIVSVKCGAEPGAILNVSSAGHAWKMLAADRSATVLIGAEHFDCGWHDMPVSINYRRSGDFQGDLVSLELN